MAIYLSNLLEQYTEKNNNNYEPVAVGKFGIRLRSDIFKKDLSQNYLKNKVIHQNTLTIGMGTKQIDIGILTENKNYSVSPAYKTFKINVKLVNPMYLKYYFKYWNDYFSQKFLIASARQGKKVDIENLLNIQIYLPDLNEQNKIVNDLEKLENINKQIDKLDNKLVLLHKSLILQQTFNTENYKKQLCEISKLKSGKTIDLAKENEGGDILYIKVSDMTLEGNEKYLVNSTKHISRETAQNNIFPKGSIIFPKNGGAIFTNKKRISVRDTAVDLNTMGIIPDQSIITDEYLYAWFLNFDLSSIVTGSAVPTINAKTLGKIEVSFPPLIKQNEIVDKLLKINEIRAKIYKELKLVKELFNSKLNNYFGV